jgi:hypothetical protein
MPSVQKRNTNNDNRKPKSNDLRISYVFKKNAYQANSDSMTHIIHDKRSLSHIDAYRLRLNVSAESGVRIYGKASKVAIYLFYSIYW